MKYKKWLNQTVRFAELTSYPKQSWKLYWSSSLTQNFSACLSFSVSSSDETVRAAGFELLQEELNLLFIFLFFVQILSAMSSLTTDRNLYH